MHDRRVVRGSTHAAMVIPAGTYPDNLFGTTSPGKKGTNKSKRTNQPGPSEEFFQREVRTPEPVAGRQNIDIQTDQFVEELTDKAPKYEIGNQTEFILERPQTPHNIPLKRGVDKKTLVEDNELFKFDKDVQPILAVLCGKTLEQARMEVLEEEELRVMRTQQTHFGDLQRTEHADATRMEQMEARKLQEFERRKALERERKKNKIAAHRKICSRTLAKGYLSHLHTSAVGYLTDVGYFTDTFQVEVLEQNVLPWLFTQVEAAFDELNVLGDFGDVFLGANLDECLSTHDNTVR
jgi:radial spoke head protein 3